MLWYHSFAAFDAYIVITSWYSSVILAGGRGYGGSSRNWLTLKIV